MTLADTRASAPVTTPRTPGIRFHQLDGLRAVAAVMVMMRHSLTPALKAGVAHTRLHFFGDFSHEVAGSGVELFFVLSGVVLLRPYLRTGRKFESHTYVRRRMERLWPPFLAAWVLSGAAVLLVGLMPTWWTRRTPSTPVFTFTGWAAQLPILNFGWASYNAAWWSLTVEMLFYISVILLIPLLVSRSRPKVACVALLLFSIPLSLGFAVRHVPHVPIAFIQLLRYGPCFALGILLAAIDFPRWARVSGLIVGLLWAMVATESAVLDLPLGFGLFYAGLIAWALSPASSVGKALSVGPLVWLGERSYSLFLTHFAVFTIVCCLMSKWMRSATPFWLLSRPIEYVAALLVAMLIFHTTERRFAKNLMTVGFILPPMRLKLD